MKSNNEPRTMVIAYWVVTVVLCLQMSFTAYAQLRLPQVAAMFAHLGFPVYFRVELSWAKLLGAVALLTPVPAWLKEWAYAGYGITLVSALIAHWAMGDAFAIWQWSAGTSMLFCISWLLGAVSPQAARNPASQKKDVGRPLILWDN